MDTRNAIDSLRAFAVTIDGEFVENQNGGFLTFKNDFGTGNAKAFKLFPGLEVITLNLTSKKSLLLEDLYRCENGLHFIFCTEGKLTHSFEGDAEKKTINRLQNVIIGNSENKSSSLLVEPNLKLRLSIISVIDISSLTSEIGHQSQLSKLLESASATIQNIEDYSYFGEISSDTAPFVETLIKTNLSGLSNRLINEAAVFKILSSQYSNHNKEAREDSKQKPLSKLDSLKIVQLSEYISQNLEENITLNSLTIMSGLNQKKIQKGFQFFFDETVNKFISSLRILKAKELLETTDLSISEIVYKIGLNNRSYFSKIFYKKYGLIPTEYRKYHYISNPTFQLSYSSDANKSFTDDDLEEILNEARANNKLLQITGCLIYYEDSFFQILEGPKNEVLELVKKIEKDPRNTNLTVLFKGVKSGRTFKEWNMAVIKDDFSLDTLEGDEEKVPVDFLAMADIKNPIANKYVWEKARNYLIVNQEVDK